MARNDARNRAKFWVDTRVPGMSLMRADFTTHDYAPHTHDGFVIAVTESGGAEINSARIVERVHPSVLFVSNPEERQSARMAGSERWLYRSIYLGRPAIDHVAAALGMDTLPFVGRSMFHDEELIERFSRLHQALETGADALQADELLTDVFGLLFHRHGSSGRRPQHATRDRVLANKVIELMRARYDENLGLDALAGFVGLSRFQLICLFKRTVGLTPHAYLIQLRLGAACRHLRRGYSPAESAAAAGFYDQSALIKHFKRCYGITPRQFAEATAGNFSQYGSGTAP